MIGYIYKILVHDKIYIGSTKNIKRRTYQHNYQLKKKFQISNIYKYAIHHNINKLDLIILEKNNYKNKKNLLWIERKYIEYYNSILNGLNMILPIYSSNEWDLILKVKNIFNIDLPIYNLYILIYKHNNIYNKIMYIILKSIQQNTSFIEK